MWMIWLGISAGILTTLTGFGGGMLLVVILALVWDPVSALAVTSLALLGGNGHRLWLFRGHIDWQLARPFLAGLVPASVLGAWFAVSLPEAVLHATILGMAALAMVRLWVLDTWRIPAWALGPAGLASGVMGAASGGIGPLIGLVVLSAGASGDVYIATMALASVFMHLGRLLGYGLSGGIMLDTVLAAAYLTGSLVLGNWIGKWLRAQMSQQSLVIIEHATPIVCALFAAIGLGR